MSLKSTERIKYETVWDIADYRKISPGEIAVDELLIRLDDADTVIDIGCGTGRAAKRIEDNGNHVYLFDIARNCLDPNISATLYVGCLWEGIPITADWGYCTDVMEHIPEKRVCESILNIATSVNNAYFRIYLHKDNGKFIDDTLHMTVKPAAWWLAELSKHFSNIEMSSNGTVATFICTEKG